MRPSSPHAAPGRRRARSRGAERAVTLDDVALVLALVPVIVLPLLVGGVHPSVAAGAAALELAALVLLATARARAGRRLRVSLLGAPLFFGWLWTLLQVLPLPLPLRQLLAAHTTETVAFVTSPLSTAAAAQVRSVLSLDPPETAFALLRLSGACALFLVVHNVVHSATRQRESVRLAFRVLLIGGGLLFVTALMHELLQAERIWGVFRMRSNPFSAPLVNPNHLARAFGGFAFLLLGRALAVRERREQLLFFAVAALCGMGVFLTLSRGGMVAFFSTSVLFVLLLVRLRRDEKRAAGSLPEREHPERFAPFVVPAVLVISMGLAMWLAREVIVREVSSLESEQVESSKLNLYGPALSLWSNHGVVGVGNNAFGVAIAAHQDGSGEGAGALDGDITFTHPENAIVAAIVEHGTGGVVLLVLALLTGLVLVGSLRDRRQLAALPALVFLVLGDQFDFFLEITAGTFLGACVLALCAAQLSDQRAVLRLPRPLGVVVIVALVAVSATAAVQATAGWRRALDAAILAAPPEQRAPLLEEALALHPADAPYAYLLAVEARRKRDPARALLWANRSINLWPTLRGAHVEAARALAATGRLEQAMLEYRAAQRGVNPGAVVAEVFERTPDVALRRRALPPTAAGVTLLCRRLLKEARLDEAQACADEVAGFSDASVDEQRRPLELALLRTDVPGAAARLEAFQARITASASGSLRGGDAAVIAKATELVHGLEVARAAAQALQPTSDTGPLLSWRLDAALRSDDVPEAQALLAQLRTQARSAEAVDNLDRLEVKLAQRVGEPGRAQRLLMRLTARHPRDVELLAALGTVELELGQVRQAYATLARAKRVKPEHRAVKALERALEQP